MHLAPFFQTFILTAHHTFTLSLSHKSHTFSNTEHFLCLSQAPCFSSLPLCTTPSPHSTLYLQCSMHCKLCNCWMGAWLAEGSTSLLSAHSQLTDQTSILHDDNNNKNKNNSCIMTQFLSDLLFPKRLDVQQHSASSN